MRVLVTGAYGLIGAACLARLHHEGHEVIGAGRAVAAARRRYPYARWIEADFRRLVTPEAWEPLLKSVDAVVNCVGAFQAGMRDDLRRAHVEAPRALFAACERTRIRIVHVSAVGADVSGVTEFMQGKGLAEQDLASRDFHWLILRPGVVLAPNVYGGTAMFRGLAAVPVVTPVVAAERTIQVVAIEDVTATVAWALGPAARLRQSFDLMHPQPLRLDSIVMATRAWLGFGEQPVWRLPRGLGRVMAAGADRGVVAGLSRRHRPDAVDHVLHRQCRQHDAQEPRCHQVAGDPEQLCDPGRRQQ